MALQRLSLALHPDAIIELKEIAADQRVTVTEAVKRAISMYRWFIRQHKEGNTIAVIDAAGTVTPKEFVILV